MRFAFLALAVAGGSVAFAQQPVLRTLDPALSPDGSTIAFSWQGDVWTVPSSGGMARRLTVNPAGDESPVWTPDSKSIIFSSNRTGVSDLYAMASDGTGFRRLTWSTGASTPYSVSPDGQWVYGNTASFGRGNVFRVSIKGGELVRLTLHPFEIQFTADVSPDGSKVAFCSGGSGGQWRKPLQHGSNTPEIWIGAPTTPLTGLEQVTHNEYLDMYPRFVTNDELLLMSNRGGGQNVWLTGLNGKNAKQVTHFGSGTIRSLTVSRPNKTFVFQRNSRIYLGGLNGSEPTQVPIFAPDDSRRPLQQAITVNSGISDYQVSPNGRRLLVAMRGDLFVSPETGGTTKQLTKNPGWDGQGRWLTDKDIVYATGGTLGKKSVHKMSVDGTDSVFVDDSADLMHPVPSPDRQWVAMLRGDRDIVVAPAAGGVTSPAFQGRFNSALDGDTPFSWSPDGAWLVVNSTNERGGSDIVMVKRDGSQKILLSRVGKAANTPQFLPNGRGVYYLATEGLDFSEARDSKSVLTMIDLVPEPMTFTEDDYDKLDEAPTKEEKPAVVVKVVMDGLKDRKRRILADAQGAWAAPDGKSIYAAVNGGLVRVPSSGPGAARPVSGVTGAVQWINPGSKGKLLLLQAGKLVALSPGPEAATTPLNISARITIDNRKEEMALFNEAWWALSRQFYDPKMHGKDWNQVRQEFEPEVAQVTSRDDFYNLMGEMVERLDSSHQGANTSEPFRPENPQPLAWIGVDFDPAAAQSGRCIVSKIYANTPAAHPDSTLLVGDEVTSINGSTSSEGAPLTALMVDQAGKKVVLGVRRGGSDIKVTIKPVSGAARAAVIIDDWEEWNRKEVDRLSSGTLAYTHVRAMDAASLDTFLSDIQDETVGKKGIIVDVRFNGGGFTSHIILDIMRKVPWLKRTFRDWPDKWVSENVMRGNSLEMPAACITNEYSFSNAEIFSEGFRRLKLGPVIGEPTGGAVIGTGAYSLWDGGSIRMPGIGVYTVDGENLEGAGRKPDFDVPYDPVLWMKGRDAQIEKAVAELSHGLR